MRGGRLDNVIAALAALQAGPKVVASSRQKLTTKICNSPPTVTLMPNARTAPIGRRPNPEPIVERPRRPRRITVISPYNAWACASCGDTGEFLRMDKAGALCLDCADLGHLEFLPSGDAALTRRATKSQPIVRCRGALEHTTQSL